MSGGFQINTDFSGIAPNSPSGQQLPVTTDKLGHLVHIVDSGTKTMKDGQGTRAILTLEIIDGPYKGVTGEYGINIAHPNQETVRIGFSELSAIAHCVGVLRVGNSAELHRKPFRILVRQQKDNPQYTEVYGVLDVNGNEPKKAGQGPVAPQPAQQSGGFAPQQTQPPAGGFAPGPAQGQAPGGFAPGPAGGAPGWAGGAPAQAPAQGQAPGGAPGWAGGGAQQGGAPSWSAGGGAPGGAPGWAAGN